eukprot:COSAG03_NODE_1671_length_3675_cov_173.755593_4_plen_123_part_00
MQGESTARPRRQQRAIVPPLLLASEIPAPPASERHRERHRDRHTERHRDRHTESDTETKTHTHTNRDIQRHRDRDRDSERETQRQTQRGAQGAPPSTSMETIAEDREPSEYLCHIYCSEYTY